MELLEALRADDEELWKEETRRLSTDLREAARTLSAQEARFLVDAYYSVQHYRIQANNQDTALTKSGEPNRLMPWLKERYHQLERQVQQALDAYSQSHSVGIWSRAQVGIGPVLAAGLLAHIDIAEAPTVGHIWSFCFPSGTLIETPDGDVPIQDIKAGMTVLGADGWPTVVKQTFTRPYCGTMIRLKARGLLPIDATEEHPFLVRQRNGNIGWLKAREIGVGDRVALRPPVALGFPTLQPTITWRTSQGRKDGSSTIPVTTEIAWFMGRFLADGSTTIYREGKYRRGGTAITFGYHRTDTEKTRAFQIAQQFGAARWSDTGTGLQLYFGRLRTTEQFRHWFGVDAGHKRVPAMVWAWPEEARRAFILGYWDGDGHVVKRGRTVGFGLASSSSRTLAMGMQRLAATLDIFMPLHLQQRTTTVSTIRGHTIHQQAERYVMSLRPGNLSYLSDGVRCSDSVWSNRQPIHADGVLWTVVTATTQVPYRDQVFNFSTDSETYVAGNVAVHNCGLNPTAVWKEGERRPWNAKLKVIAWKCGVSFTKCSNRPHCLYGSLYKQRKALEQSRNEQKLFADQAADALKRKRIGKETEAYKWYSQGMLPPAHIQARSERWATKLFLAHWQEAMYVATYGTLPPKPYVLDRLGHTTEIIPPSMELIPGWAELRSRR